MPVIRKLLLLASLALFPAVSFAEPTLQERLAAAMEQQDNAAAARLIKGAVRNAGKLDWQSLFSVAQAAASAGRVADAHFLYQAAQMRARAELTAFPPIDRNGVAVLHRDLKQQAGDIIEPMMVTHSREYLEAVKRLQHWQPVYPKNYKPEWLFDVTRGKEIAVAVEQVKMEHMAVLEDLAWFLGDEKYLKALRVHQAYLLAPEEEQMKSRRKAENAAAEKFMLDMEKASGRQGFMSLR